MIFGMRALEAERLALVERSRALREGLLKDLEPLNPAVSVATMLRNGLRWASRAMLVYSLLKRR